MCILCTFINVHFWDAQIILILTVSYVPGSEFLRIKDNGGGVNASNKVGLAQVKFQDEWGTICGEGWSFTQEFCQLKNSGWE